MNTVFLRPRGRRTSAFLSLVAAAVVGCASPSTRPDPQQSAPEAQQLLARLDAILSSLPTKVKTPEERIIVRTIAEFQVALQAEERAIHTLSLIDDRYHEALALFALLYESASEFPCRPFLSRLRTVVDEIHDFRMGHARVCLAMAYAKRGADSDAISELRDYHCNRDDGWLAICKVSQTYITEGRADQAVILLRNVQCHRFQEVMGIVTRQLCRAGKFEQAVEIVKRMMEGASRDSGILEVLENAQCHPTLLLQADLVNLMTGESSRVMALAALSDAFAAAGNAAEAERRLEEAERLLERTRKATGEDTNYLYSMCLLARSRWKAGHTKLASDILKRVECLLATSDDRSMKAAVGQALAESRYEIGDVSGAVAYAKSMQGGARNATLRSITLRLVECGKVEQAEDLSSDLVDDSYEKIEILLRIAKYWLTEPRVSRALPLLRKSIALLDQAEKPRDGNMTPSPGEPTWDDLCCEAASLLALVDVREALRNLSGWRTLLDADMMAESIIEITRDYSSAMHSPENLADILPSDLRLLAELGRIGAQVQRRKMRR